MPPRCGNQRFASGFKLELAAKLSPSKDLIRKFRPVIVKVQPLNARHPQRKHRAGPAV
jgi:hypothetical protein